MKKVGIRLSIMIGIAMAAFSCAARYDMVLGKSGAAVLTFTVEADSAVMGSMAAKAAAFSGEDPSNQVTRFDIDGMKQAISARKDMKLLSLEKISETSLRGKLSINDLSALGSTSVKDEAFFSYSEKKGIATLSFTLNRGNAARLPSLIVGLDRTFLEILAPPALYGDDLSEDEYVQALLPFIGKDNMPAFQAAQAEFRITPPGKISDYTGGRVDGNTFITTVRAMKAMVLDSPIEFSLSWKL